MSVEPYQEKSFFDGFITTFRNGFLERIDFNTHLKTHFYFKCGLRFFALFIFLVLTLLRDFLYEYSIFLLD